MSILSIASNLLSETGLSSLVSSALSPQYSLTVKSTNEQSNNPLGWGIAEVAFEPSSWISFEHIAESSISAAPVETGSYSSFNKVQRPAEIRITFTVEGWLGMSGDIANPYTSASHTRTGIINLLEDMRKYTYTYDLETPDKVYSGYDLIHFDYQTKSNNGVTLLTVNAFFQEVRETLESIISGGNISTTLSANVNLTNLSADTSVMSSVLGNVSDASGTTSSGLSSLSEKVSGIIEQTSNTVSSVMSTVTTNIQSAVSTVSSVYSKVDSAIPNQAKTAAYSIYNGLR